MSTNLLSKKLVLVALLAVGAVSAILVASSIAQATAQQQKMMWQGGYMPKISGSVSITDEASNFINENVKVSFVQAAQTAQDQVQDGKVIGGHLGMAQGYLVYTFLVTNTSNQAGQVVIVDAGKGDVLYTSESQSFGSFGPMSGQWGGHDFAGPWNGHAFGMWH